MLPDDVQAIVVPVLAHRVIPTGETQMARRSTAEVLQDLMRRVPVPRRRPLRLRAVRRLRDLLTTRGRAFVAAGITWCCAGSGSGSPT